MYPEAGRWYFGNHFGTSFFNIAESSHVGTGAGWPDDLYLHHDKDDAVLFSIAGGYTWITHQAWLPFFSLGANLSHYFPAKINGQILQYGLPQFLNYNYTFKTQSTTLLATAKANIVRLGNVSPYVSAGVGSAFNRVTSFQEYSKSSNTIPRLPPDFQNNTSHHFSYLLEIGMDYILQNNIWLSVGYQYSDLGKIETGSGRAGFAPEYLSTTLVRNNIVFQIHYYFDRMES